MNNANEPIAPVLAQSANSYEAVQHMGLTKREYFAAMAMQGLLSGYEVGGEGTDEIIACIAKESVATADALLAELERTK